MYGRSQLVVFSAVLALFATLLAWYWFVLGSEPWTSDYAPRPAIGVDLPEAECQKANIVCIRVANASEFNFDGFDINFGGRLERFGFVGAGALTAYRRVENAYRSNRTVAYSADRKFAFTPTDHVGEEYLSPGIYTYRYTGHLLSNPYETKNSVIHGELDITFELDNHGI